MRQVVVMSHIKPFDSLLMALDALQVFLITLPSCVERKSWMWNLYQFYKPSLNPSPFWQLLVSVFIVVTLFLCCPSWPGLSWKRESVVIRITWPLYWSNKTLNWSIFRIDFNLWFLLFRWWTLLSVGAASPVQSVSSSSHACSVLLQLPSGQYRQAFVLM